MRSARVVCLLMILGISAVAAYAQTPVDPVIRTNSGPPGDPACGGSGQPICLTSSTLTEDYATAMFPISFVNDTGSDLFNLTLVFTDVPGGTMFQCFTNIWTDCSQSSSGTTTTFTMVDDPAKSSGPCDNNGSAGGTCPGFLGVMYEATTTSTPLTSETPEPDSIILFGTGLVALFVAGKRRLHSRA
jgi:hypothetical protein